MSCCFFLYPPPGDDLLEDVGSGVGLKITVFFNNDSDEALKEEQMLQQIATDSEGKKASTRLREEYCEENLAWESSSYAEETQRCINQPSSFVFRTLSQSENTSASITSSNVETFNKVTDEIISQDNEFNYIQNKFGLYNDNIFSVENMYQRNMKSVSANDENQAVIQDEIKPISGNQYTRDKYAAKETQENNFKDILDASCFNEEISTLSFISHAYDDNNDTISPIVSMNNETCEVQEKVVVEPQTKTKNSSKNKENVTTTRNKRLPMMRRLLRSLRRSR